MPDLYENMRIVVYSLIHFFCSELIVNSLAVREIKKVHYKTLKQLEEWCIPVFFLILVSYFLSQVAVALSHAAILEESMRARDLLMQQNVALDLARREAESAIHARNDFLAVVNHEMRTPIHAIVALSSLLQETELTPEQRLMVETVLKSSNLLGTLINDVLDLSKLEDGSLQLDVGTFNLPSLFREVWYGVAFSSYCFQTQQMRDFNSVDD